LEFLCFKAKQYEVLFLLDPVNELVVQSLTEFDGKKLQSVGKGTVQLGSKEEKEEAKQALKEQAAGHHSALLIC
jgi:molecular chaperone HtpG